MAGAHSFDERHLFPHLISAPAALPTPATAEPPLSRHWEPVDTAHGNKHLLLLTKEKHAAELAELEKHWQQTHGSGCIVSVHRIQNSALHHRFEGMQKNTPSLTKRVAYHGTRTNVPTLIYDSPTGFDMSRGASAPGSVTARHAHEEFRSEVNDKGDGMLHGLCFHVGC
jgi:hypothetical protein